MALDNFGFITVMNIKVLDVEDLDTYTTEGVIDYDDIAQDYVDDGLTELATINSLSISNVTQEGPRKEARGGLYAQPLVRYGKTMRIELEDVVANLAALKTIGGAKGTGQDLEVDETFAKHHTLIGETFVVDQSSGDRKWVIVVFPRFLPDSIFDLTMEAEGDIGMITIAGELFPSTDDVFFAIVERPEPSPGE